MAKRNGDGLCSSILIVTTQKQELHVNNYSCYGFELSKRSSIFLKVIGKMIISREGDNLYRNELRRTIAR